MATYNIVMDDEKLGLKPEVLFQLYGDIDARARELADPEFSHELRISQDGRIKTKFRIVVSDRMAPHLLAAIQRQAESDCGMGLKSYLHRLQEQLMAQMFASASDGINVRFG